MPYRLDNAIKPLASIEATAAITASPHFDKQQLSSQFRQFLPGQQFKAQVLSRQQDGSFTVKIGDVVARMNLPEGSHAGDTLDIRLISTQPQLSFTITDGASETIENSSLHTIETSLTGNDRSKTLPVQLPASASIESSITELSNVSKLVASLIQLSSEKPSQLTLKGKLPILQTPSELTQTEHTAGMLGKQVSESGLFYESHIADWVNGRKTLQDLLSEPQSRLLAEINNPQSSQTLSATSELTQLLQQQLHTMETQTVHWQGELFPGQKMEWEIRKKNSSGQQKQYSDENTDWQSVVRFHFPILGNVSATLNLSGDKLNLMIQTTDENSAKLLRTNAGVLMSAIDSTGTKVEAIMIHANDAANKSE